MPDSIPVDAIIATDGNYIGFDFGLKRIGIASGNFLTRNAAPLDTIRNINGRPEWDRLDTILAAWLPDGLVVGQPLTLDGSKQDIQLQADAFARRLHKRYELPVFRTDERYSSIEASSIIAHNRRHTNRRKSTHSDTDKVAAAVILEQWLNDDAT